MKMYLCKDCGHEVHAEDRPRPIRWTDGHVCYFELAKISECCLAEVVFNNATGDYICSECRDKQ